jgi:hypothetical protein
MSGGACCATEGGRELTACGSKAVKKVDKLGVEDKLRAWSVAGGGGRALSGETIGVVIELISLVPLLREDRGISVLCSTFAETDLADATDAASWSIINSTNSSNSILPLPSASTSCIIRSTTSSLASTPSDIIALFSSSKSMEPERERVSTITPEIEKIVET